MANAYDHWRKAGNQGDVVKHVALIAALDVILDAHKKKEFLYADTYAGYAHIPLLKSNEREKTRPGSRADRSRKNRSCALPSS